MTCKPAWALGLVLLLSAGHAAKAALPAPDVYAVQRAYEEAKKDADSNPAHIDDLQISSALCQSLKGTRQVACQISFVRRSEPRGRLYFEVITLEDRGTQWALLSGLCKSRPAR